jgi:hypothetical protein
MYIIIIISSKFFLEKVWTSELLFILLDNWNRVVKGFEISLLGIGLLVKKKCWKLVIRSLLLSIELTIKVTAEIGL